MALQLLPGLVWLERNRFSPGWISAIVFPCALLLLFCAIFGNRLWLACLLLAPFALLAPLEAFYIWRYQTPSTAEILATVSATNPREIREYLADTLIPICIALATVTAFTIATIRLALRNAFRWQHRSRKLTLALAIAAPPILMLAAWFTVRPDILAQMRANTPRLFIHSITLGYPFGVIPRLIEYRRQSLAVQQNVERLKNFSFHTRRDATVSARQIYVLVIGESSARNHWQIFGYERSTNPELSRIKNLIKIPDMLSSWVVSRDAIPQLLTRKPIDDNATLWSEPSIVQVTREAGFHTYWISNQLPLGAFDSQTAVYANEASDRQYLNQASWTSPGSVDEVMLEPLEITIKQSSGDIFIVLHMMGSHTFYDYRYPADFHRFTPTMTDAHSDVSSLSPGHYKVVLDNVQEFVNSYDNTILYTDHVLARIIGVLQDSAAVSALWFVSDHGERMPSSTCPNKAGHGFGTRDEYEIPALFWYSDAYVAAHPERVDALATNANGHTLSADTFESLIDMVGIDFPGHDESRSLFSWEWRYRPRLVTRFWTADFDKAQFDEDCQTVTLPARTIPASDTHAGLPATPQ
ncbi:phosphoethanolamine transferase [Rudaea cellulosilytica]|uniref:phosphoethanolamine transferase n=1 Tax=Rudaea cellulosilytica TaxID=540746 RepID=UPI00035E068F|nr:phosphoethanolamine transferase [Rudaea cellulosilytica]